MKAVKCFNGPLHVTAVSHITLNTTEPYTLVLLLKAEVNLNDHAAAAKASGISALS